MLLKNVHHAINTNLSQDRDQTSDKPQTVATGSEQVLAALEILKQCGRAEDFEGILRSLKVKSRSGHKVYELVKLLSGMNHIANQQGRSR